MRGERKLAQHTGWDKEEIKVLKRNFWNKARMINSSKCEYCYTHHSSLCFLTKITFSEWLSLGKMWFFPNAPLGKCLETFLVSYLGGMGLLVSAVDVIGTTNYPVIHRTVPEQRTPHIWVPKVNSADVEKPSN